MFGILGSCQCTSYSVSAILLASLLSFLCSLVAVLAVLMVLGITSIQYGFPAKRQESRLRCTVRHPPLILPTGRVICDDKDLRQEDCECKHDASNEYPQLVCHSTHLSWETKIIHVIDQVAKQKRIVHLFNLLRFGHTPELQDPKTFPSFPGFIGLLWCAI